jgi:Ca2+-binding EF-hand superfamily protein
MKKTLQVAVAVAFLSVGFGAQAAEGTAKTSPEAIQKQFQQLDANSDGMIDEKEAAIDMNLSKSFKSIAKDGKLDEQGYSAWVAKNPSKPKG